MIELITERLLLRNWKLEDAIDVFEYAVDADVGPNAGWEPHKSIEDSLSIVEMFINKQEVWAVVSKGNNKVIGSIGLHQDERRPGINGKMIGYSLSKAFWGQGLMSEAVKRVIKYGFEEEKLDIISCNHFDGNSRSQRVIEKCDFKFEGILRCACKIYNGTVLDEWLYSIKKEEFFNRI